MKWYASTSCCFVTLVVLLANDFCLDAVLSTSAECMSSPDKQYLYLHKDCERTLIRGPSSTLDFMSWTASTSLLSCRT